MGKSRFARACRACQKPHRMAPGCGGALREQDRDQVPHHRRHGPLDLDRVRHDRPGHVGRPGPASHDPRGLHHQPREQADALAQLPRVRRPQHGRDRALRQGAAALVQEVAKSAPKSPVRNSPACLVFAPNTVVVPAR